MRTFWSIVLLSHCPFTSSPPPCFLLVLSTMVQAFLLMILYDYIWVALGSIKYAGCCWIIYHMANIEVSQLSSSFCDFEAFLCFELVLKFSNSSFVLFCLFVCFVLFVCLFVFWVYKSLKFLLYNCLIG